MTANNDPAPCPICRDTGKSYCSPGNAFRTTIPAEESDAEFLAAIEAENCPLPISAEDESAVMDRLSKTPAEAYERGYMDGAAKGREIASQKDAEIARLTAERDAALMVVIDLGGEVRAPEIEDAQRMRADAERCRSVEAERDMLREAINDVLADWRASNSEPVEALRQALAQSRKP